MKFSVLTIAAFAAATSGTFFCDVMAQETRALEGPRRALKSSKKSSKKAKCEGNDEPFNLEDEITGLHAKVDHAKAQAGYNVFTAVRVRHSNNIISDAEKEAMNWGGKIYDGLHTPEFDTLNLILESLADPSPALLLQVVAPFIPGDSSRRRLFSFGSLIGCIGGAVSTGAACTVGEVATAGIDTPACAGAGIATVGACGSMF